MSELERRLDFRARIAALEAECGTLQVQRDKWRDQFMTTYEKQEWLQAMRDSLAIHLADAKKRIAELEAENASLSDHWTANKRAAVLAEREACAAWHDLQAEDVRKTASPESADNRYERGLYNHHKFSAIAIRARSAS